jgi:hypothetical protein
VEWLGVDDAAVGPVGAVRAGRYRNFTSVGESVLYFEEHVPEAAHPNHKRICDEVCPAICNIFTGEDRVGDLRRSGDVERGVALIDADRPP